MNEYGIATATDQRTGGEFYATEEGMRDYIARGLVEPIGSRHFVHDLHWIGTNELSKITSDAEAAGYVTSRTLRNTKYYHRRETAKNPPKVWMLIHLPGTKDIYAEVAASCFQPFHDPASLP